MKAGHKFVPKDATGLKSVITESQKRTKAIVENTLEIVGMISTIDMKALRIQDRILRDTLEKLDNNEISELAASKITANLGLSIDKIGSRAGLGRTATTAIQINNNIDDNGNRIEDDNVVRFYLPQKD